MSRQRHIETVNATAFQEVTVIRSMLDDLHRTIRLLNDDIAAEQERTQIFDISDPLYSMLARTLVARRANVNATVTALAQRLHAITATIPSVIAQAA